MKKTMLASLIGAGALLAATTGMAATISEGPQTIGPQQVNWTTNPTIGGASASPATALTFNGFDTNLGTLNNVTIMVSGAFDGTMTATANPTGGGMQIAELKANDFMAFDLFDDGTVDQLVQDSDGSGPLFPLVSLAPGASTTQAISGGTNGFVNFDWAGAGGVLSNFTSAWTFGCSNTLFNVSSTTGPGDIVFNATGECSVKVDYDYTPAAQPAPIPGSLLLMAAGLLGFGASRRK